MIVFILNSFCLASALCVHLCCSILPLLVLHSSHILPLLVLTHDRTLDLSWKTCAASYVQGVASLGNVGLQSHLYFLCVTVVFILDLQALCQYSRRAVYRVAYAKFLRCFSDRNMLLVKMKVWLLLFFKNCK